MLVKEKEEGGWETVKGSATKVVDKAVTEEVDNKEKTSEYEDSESEEEYIKFTPNPIKVSCPFDNCNKKVYEISGISNHIKKEHGYFFKNLIYCRTFLDEYLQYWAENQSILNDDKHLPPIKDSQEGFTYKIIDSHRFHKDGKIRTKLQQEKLNSVLQEQENERKTEANEPRQCLFCSLIFDNRSSLFQHMYQEHGFNIGLPDNLVYVEEFLSILEDKLKRNVCIYCERTFTSAIVLRKHMRKKKHFKIHSRNHGYDPYYIVNYAEPGKDWKQLEKEENDDVLDDQGDSAWMQWDEIEKEQTHSLFDNQSFDTTTGCLNHMKKRFRFDLVKIQKDLNLDFYQMVQLINCIRFHKLQNKCFLCSSHYESPDNLESHYLNSNCLGSEIPKTAKFFKDPNYLLPILENDALIMFVDTLFEEEGSTNTTTKEEGKKGDKVDDTVTLDPSQKDMLEKIAQLNIDQN